LAPENGAKRIIARTAMMRNLSEDVSARLGRVWRRIALDLDRQRHWLLLGLSALFFATAVLRARATPFWHDEIYTVLLSRVPTVWDVWRAARDGVDLMPPLNLFLTRALEALPGPELVSSRLPAMIGFWTMSMVVFGLVRARSNVLVAGSAALLPWFTQGYRYSYEARGYGVMLALFALLLWSWSEAARGHRRRLWLPVFAVVCAASLWNHYFAVVTFVPVAAGELYRCVRTRSPDWPLWMSGAVGLACCGPLVLLVRNASAQGATYWRHATWADVGATYWFLFHNLWSLDRWVIVLLVGAIAFGFLRGRFALPPSIAPGHEVVAGVIAVCMPAMTVGLGWLIGGFTPRYALPAVVSCAIVTPLAVWWLSRKSPVVEGVLLIVLTIGVVQPSIDLFRHPMPFHDPIADRPMLTEHLRASSPVVVAGTVQFLELWYYAPPEVRSRLWYVADPDRARQYIRWDTGDRAYIKLARWAPITIRTYEELANQRVFTLYDNGLGWLPAQLHDAGAVMTHFGVERGARVSRVEGR
jgi:hypothetical protein